MKLGKRLKVAMIVGFTTLILYALSIAPAVDAVDELLAEGLIHGSIEGTDAASILMSIDAIVLYSAGIVAITVTMRDVRGIIVAALAVGLTMVIMLVVSFVGLSTYPGWSFTLGQMFLMPVLYACYVLRDPAIFGAINGVILVVSLVIIITISGVDD